MGVGGSRGLLCAKLWGHGVLPQSRHIGRGLCRPVSASDTAPPPGDLGMEAVLLTVSESGESSVLADETPPGLGQGWGGLSRKQASRQELVSWPWACWSPGGEREGGLRPHAPGAGVAVQPGAQSRSASQFFMHALAVSFSCFPSLK